MLYRKEQFVNGGIYYITLRRIGDNLLFEDVNDYYRGIFSIYEFNNAKTVDIRKRREEWARFKEETRHLQLEMKMNEGRVFAKLAKTRPSSSSPFTLGEPARRDRPGYFMFCFYA